MLGVDNEAPRGGGLGLTQQVLRFAIDCGRVDVLDAQFLDGVEPLFDLGYGRREPRCRSEDDLDSVGSRHCLCREFRCGVLLLPDSRSRLDGISRYCHGLLSGR